MVDLVVFDLDGVLVDSEGLLSRVWSQLLGEREIEISPDQLIRRFAGATDTSMVDVIAEETGTVLDQDVMHQIRQRARQKLADELAAVEGAHDLLSALPHRKCICSNSQPDRILQSLQITGLGGFFEDTQLISAAHVERPKPHPDIHELAATRFGSVPAGMVVIEDSATGVRAGVAAGCRVIGFTGASHALPEQAEILRDAGAVAVAPHLDEIIPLIAKLADA